MHWVLGKVLGLDMGQPVPGMVTNTRERLMVMRGASHQCRSPLLSSTSPHRIWGTVIRQDEYLSSLPRKNGLGKLTAGFCSPKPIFKQDGKELII